MTSFGNSNFVDKLRSFQTLTAKISQKIRVADPLLQELISQAGIEVNDPVVFYGYAAVMPQWKSNNDMVISEKTWLPNPLQLLEEPINSERRIVYLRRFMERSVQGGYFIMQRVMPKTGWPTGVFFSRELMCPLASMKTANGKLFIMKG